MDWQTRWRVYGAEARRKMRRLTGGEVDLYPARPSGTDLSPSVGLLAEFAPRNMAYDPTAMEAWQDTARARLSIMSGYRRAEEPGHVCAVADSVPVPFASGHAAGPAIKRTTHYLRARAATAVPVTIIAAENIAEPAPVFLFLQARHPAFISVGAKLDCR